MSLPATGTGSVSAATLWLHGLWAYYREYTHTAIHAAATAALTAFGLLVFIDPLFVVLAIASYICPPVILYSIDADAGKTSDSAKENAVRAGTENSGTNPDSDDGDSDSDGDDGDTDSAGTDTDTDTGG